jgi:hypothetical protein
MADSEQKDTYGSLGAEPVSLEEWAKCLAAELEKTVRARPLLSVAGFLLASIRRR